MMAFRDALDFCDLQDLGFSGPNYTWCNRRLRQQRTLIRLDRMVANSVWQAIFHKVKVQHRSMATSDHCSLLLHLTQGRKARKQKRQFRFETIWLQDPACKDVVELAWNGISTTSENHTIQAKVKNCQDQLQWWNKNVFGHNDKQLKDWREKLQQLQSLNTLHEYAEDHQCLRKEINELMDKENYMWHQRS